MIALKPLHGLHFASFIGHFHIGKSQGFVKQYQVVIFVRSNYDESSSWVAYITFHSTMA